MNNETIILLANTAIEEIAKINSTDVETVKSFIREGNEIACAQFQKLMQIGVVEVNKLAA